MTIYYTGVGANKNGKHTVDEFIAIMNKHFSVECSKTAFERETYRNYKPCVQRSKMFRKHLEYNTRRNKHEFDDSIYKRKWEALNRKCNTRAQKGTLKRRCNLDEYILFSGAENRD